MAYDLIKISGLPLVTPDSGQDIVVGVGDYAKRINYNAVKADMVGTSPSYTTDTEPYLMRQTAHVGVVGKCALNKLVGGSLGWNQLVQNGNFASTSNWTAAYGGFTVSGNVATITATAQWGRIAQNVSVLSGHKYLFGADLKGTTNNYAQFGTSQYLTGTAWEHISFLYSATSTTTVQLMIGDKSTSGWQAFNAQNVQVLDLTAMFGSTIADYVYGLGSASGIAWLAKYIDLGTYHAYDSGSIQNVQATAHVTTGKNLLDVTNETSGSNAHIREYNLPNLPLGTYTVSAKCVSTASTDCAALFIYKDGTNTASPMLTNGSWSSQTFNLTKPVKAFRIYSANVYSASQSNTVVVTSAQLEFGSTATAYEPYTEHVYPLGSDTLRGFPMLVNNELAFDGDVKTADGTITRNYNIVDMGTLNWSYSSSDLRFVTTGLSLAKAISSVDEVAKMICPRYQTSAYRYVDGRYQTDKIIGLYGTGSTNYLAIKDTVYTDATTLKNSLSGVYLVYPLATETAESGTAYQKIQTIDADGTESFTTSSPVPVGHETQTPDNILAALGWLGE